MAFRKESNGSVIHSMHIVLHLIMKKFSNDCQGTNTNVIATIIIIYNNNVYFYIPHISPIVSWRFTILIERKSNQLYSNH